MSIYLVGIIGLFRKLCFREVIFDEILNRCYKACMMEISGPARLFDVATTAAPVRQAITFQM